jgi:hypothetical protein
LIKTERLEIQTNPSETRAIAEFGATLKTIKPNPKHQNRTQAHNKIVVS